MLDDFQGSLRSRLREVVERFFVAVFAADNNWLEKQIIHGLSHWLCAENVSAAAMRLHETLTNYEL